MCSPPFCRYLSILFLNIFTLLAVTQSVDNLFHSFIVFYENEHFLISNQHRSLTNVTSCSLGLLSICSYPFNILSTSIWSPLNVLTSRVIKPHSFRRLSVLFRYGISLVALLYILCTIWFPSLYSKLCLTVALYRGIILSFSLCVIFIIFKRRIPLPF